MVNKSWIFFFFACSSTTFPRKNKHESRKIHCRFYYLLLLLFLAFPSRLPPFPPTQRCFSTSWILLSSLFFSGARRGSFLFQLPWFNYSSREETVRNFTSLRSLRGEPPPAFQRQRVSKSRGERDASATFDEYIFRGRERKNSFENKRKLRVRMSRGLVKRFWNVAEFPRDLFRCPTLSRIARFEYTAGRCVERRI